MVNEVKMEEIHKEIDLIHDCIKRMANNSFMLKGWIITLYAVILGLLPEKINIWLLCGTLITITVSFWYLDAFYLRTERIYRKMYEWVLKERSEGNRELLYNLNPKNFKNKIEEVDSICKIMFSVTLRCFYGIPIIFVLIIMGFSAVQHLGSTFIIINNIIY